MGEEFSRSCVRKFATSLLIEFTYTRVEKNMRVAVVGAGVIGLTSAFAVKTVFREFEVRVFADEFSPATTGDGSAGLWSPYLLGNTPSERIL